MPDWKEEITRRLASLKMAPPRKAEIVEEVGQHLEDRYQELMAGAATEEEARRVALEELSDEDLLARGLGRVEHEVPEGPIVPGAPDKAHILSGIRQDVRFGIRMLWKNPGFTCVAVLTLALGIGANTAIFTLLNALVLRPLPVNHPEQLIEFVHAEGDEENDWCSYPMFELIQEHGRSLNGVFAEAGAGRVNAVVKGESGLAGGTTVTGGFFATLGVRPMVGRLLVNDDNRPGNAVMVISYAFWQKRFGGDPAAVGGKLTVNQVPFTVVGVTPPDFFGVEVGSSPDFWIPMRMLEQLNPGWEEWNKPFDTWLRIMGRLKPGATEQQARAELQTVYRHSLEDQVPLAAPNQREDVARMAKQGRLETLPGRAGFRGGLRWGFTKPLQILMVVVGIVLLIACANIASLLLARAVSRRREFALRLAIGANRTRLVRQLLTESLLLSLTGGVAGVLFGWCCARFLLLMVSRGPTLVPLDVAPNFLVLMFTAGVSLLTGVLFGVAPAWRATRVDPGPATKESPSGREARMLDRALVVGQLALSLALLAAAGLFLRTLRNLWAVNPGYDRNNVLMFSLDPRLSGYKGPQLTNLYRDLLAKMQALPGVRSASFSVVRPVDDEAYFVDVIESVDGHELAGDQRVKVAFNIIAPGYFSNLGIPIVLGRDFEARDRERSPKVAIISETLARLCFTNKNPLGRHISHGPPEGREDMEVVGVAKDTRYGGLRDAPRGVLYLPFFEQDLDHAFFADTTFELRYSGDVGSVVTEARREIEGVSRSLAMFRIKTLATQTRESLTEERLIATLCGFFAGLGLLVASIGLYGLMSYAVTRRTQEIGVRIALGARQSQVLWLVLRESVLLALLGAGIGLMGALADARLIASALFEVKPVDPTTLVAATALMIVFAVCTGYIPARRATKVDPMVALRYE